MIESTNVNATDDRLNTETDFTARLISAEFQLLSKKPEAATIQPDAALLACD